MKIEIELIDGDDGGWKVTQGDRYGDRLTYDEMLGLITSLTMPKERPCLQWLQTEEQHKIRRDFFKPKEPELDFM